MDFLGTKGKKGWPCTCGRVVPTVQARLLEGTDVVDVPAMHVPATGTGIEGACIYAMIYYSNLAPVLPWLPKEAPRRVGLDDLDRIEWMAAILAGIPKEHGGPIVIKSAGGEPPCP